MATGTFTFDDFAALNDQLAALVEAGIPVDVTLDESGAESVRAFAKIKSIVNRRVCHGESLSESLEGDEQEMPESYRRLMQLAVRTGDRDAALAGSNRLAESAVEIRHVAGTAFFYPLVLCLLATIGLIAFCLFFVPTLDSMYGSLRIVPGQGLRVLNALRTSMPVWTGLLAIAVLLVVAWSIRATLARTSTAHAAPTKLSLLFGLKEADCQLRCAVFAEAMADILEKGTPFEEALEIASAASGEAALHDGAAALATAAAQGTFPPDDGPVAQRFPPFLRWALWHAGATVGRERALRMAGRIYREAAERRFERMRMVVPLVVLVIVGGGATLLYGLALFVPVVELLRALAT
jgi:type II secretory pathway component PulF